MERPCTDERVCLWKKANIPSLRKIRRDSEDIPSVARSVGGSLDFFGITADSERRGDGYSQPQFDEMAALAARREQLPDRRHGLDACIPASVEGELADAGLDVHRRDFDGVFSPAARLQAMVAA